MDDADRRPSVSLALPVRDMTRCNEPGCRRVRLEHRAFCESHLRALIARVFGRNADYPA